MIAINEFKGLAGGQDFVSGLVRFVRAATSEARTSFNVRACPPCPESLQASEYAKEYSDKRLVRLCPPHSAKAIGGTDKGEGKAPPKGGLSPHPDHARTDRACPVARLVTPTPFGSFPACQVYGSAMRFSFSVAGFENSATIATPQRVKGNEMGERVSRAEAARLVGVSPATITRLVQSNPGLLDDDGRVSVDEVNQVRKVGRLAVERPRVRSDNAKAEMAEMDLAERRAKTLVRADVEAALVRARDILRATAFSLTRDRAEALTGISDPREMERALEDLMRDFLQRGVQALTQAADETRGQALPGAPMPEKGNPNG